MPVSVFVARHEGANIEGKSKMGSTNSYSVSTDEHVVTAVGEVPAVTVEVNPPSSSSKSSSSSGGGRPWRRSPPPG